MGLVVLLALSYTAVKKLAQKSKEPSSADAGLHIVTATSFRPLHSEHANSSNTSYRCYQSHSKAYDWHADSSRRNIVERSRERITPRDLEPNLSQILHLVLVHSKLIIFIYKQLKRPVAFSVVHNINIDIQNKNSSSEESSVDIRAIPGNAETESPSSDSEPSCSSSERERTCVIEIRVETPLPRARSINQAKGVTVWLLQSNLHRVWTYAPEDIEQKKESLNPNEDSV